MKSESELDALVAALRTDLPSERDSARLRARLSALGLASSEVLLSSAAAASTSATQAAGLAGAGQAAVQAGTASWALKAGVLAVVSGAVAGPAWFVHDRLTSQTPTANSASVAVKATGNAPSATRRHGAAEPTPAPAAPRVESQPASEPTRDRAPMASNGELTRARGAAAALGAARSNEPAAESPSRNSGVAPSAANVESGSSATASFAESGEGVDSTPSESGEGVDPTPSERAAERTTLREETALIDRALSALRTGEGPRAAAVLAEHRRRFPNGLLARERERAQRKLDEVARAESAR